MGWAKMKRFNFYTETNDSITEKYILKHLVQNGIFYLSNWFAIV